MSVIERAQRTRYYEIGGFPLSSLSIFNIQEAKRTHSLQYLQQVTNLCEKIKLSPQQYDKQSPANKLKFLKAFQYSILYSHNLKAIYDSKESQIIQKNAQLQQQIRKKKQTIKLHKQKVDKRKAQYRQMKVDQAKSVYQVISNQISNLKSKHQELNVIKMQIQSDIEIAKLQLNSPYATQMFLPQPSPQPPNYYPYNMNSYHSFPNLSTHNIPNEFQMNSSQMNNPNQGQKLFYQQNIQQQRESKLKTQQSNFTLNGQQILDEQNRIDQMNSRNSKNLKKQISNQLPYQIKISQQKKDSKGGMIISTNNKTISNSKNLRIDTFQGQQEQSQPLYSPTNNLIITKSQYGKKIQQEDDSSSFDDLNLHMLEKQSLVKSKSSSQTNKKNLSSAKEQSKPTSRINENDSLLLKRLKLQSNVSKKSSQSSVEYKLEDQLKQTPNLNYYLESSIQRANDLSYSKMGEIEGDIWTSTKGSGQNATDRMKMFNAQPKRKLQEQNVQNTISSNKQSCIEGSENKEIKNDYLNGSSFGRLNDDLDELDLGIDTRKPIVQDRVIKEKNETKKTQNVNIKRQYDVSINQLQQVPQQSESQLVKKDSIQPPPALHKTEDQDYSEYYQEEYEEQFQDELQESKPKVNSKDQQRQGSGDYKSSVEINVPSEASFLDVRNSKGEQIFKDIFNEVFQAKNQRVKNSLNGLFHDLQCLLDHQSQPSTQQVNLKTESSHKNEDSLLDDSFDIPEATTCGKKPKTSKKLPTEEKSNLDQSDKLMTFQHPLESKIFKPPQTAEFIQSTTFNNNLSDLTITKDPVGKKESDKHQLTVSIPLQKTTKTHQEEEQITQKNEDQISEQIEYQFEDSSKVNQSEKQQIQRKIVSLLRNKNKTKNNQSIEKIKVYQQQIQLQIDQEIKQNIKQSNLKGKQNDWKQMKRIFQNKINELKKQSGSSQIQRKLSQIEQKSNNSNNNIKKSDIGSKQNSATNSKLSNYNVSESDDNVELNYSQSILKDELKSKLKNKNQLTLSDIPSVNEGLTNSSNIKNESFNFEGSLDFSIGQKSNFGLKNNQKVTEKMIEQNQQDVTFRKASQVKIQNKRQNNLMGAQKQQEKTEQVSRSKYVKLTTLKNKENIAKQSAYTKIQQNKYVSIEDPLNNQITSKKPVIEKKISDDDDDF